MILSGHSILRANIITPFEFKQSKNGMSYGVSYAGYDVRVRIPEGYLDIEPGEFKLAVTFEHFTMPSDLLGVVHDKSTWARQGLAVQNTVIEPGWRGYLTLELTNHSKERIVVVDGDPIAQIIFHLLDEPALLPYTGKYQDQPNVPVPAKFE